MHTSIIKIKEICTLIALLGFAICSCSEELANKNHAENNTSSPVKESVINKSEFADAENRSELQEVLPLNPPEASDRGVWECHREYPETDLCSWKGVPDIIIMAYLREANQVEDYYKIVIGGEDVDDIEQCFSKESTLHSVAISVQPSVVLKNNTDLNVESMDRLDVVLDHSLLKKWHTNAIKENILSSEDFVLKDVFKQNQYIGLSIFKEGDMLSIGHSPIFVIDPEKDEIIFQKITSCDSMTPSNWNGIPVDDFINTFNKCSDLGGQDTAKMREIQLDVVRSASHGKSVCF